MSAREYRPDIDGLRTVAVLAVVFFHFGWSWFPGGYIGVDVFFVISGFLITGLVVGEYHRTGTVSFKNFYLRRSRRLFPALFATLAATCLAAAVMFSPQHMVRFGGELAASILSVSNFYFHMESGYFDTDGIYKPLLHTWSLSVEEQFYLVWPLLLFLAIPRLKGARLPLFILVIGLASLAAAEYFVRAGANVFFITPLRVFEFAIGALMVWITPMQPRNRFVLEPLLLLGLGMILASVLFYTEATPFPSLAALLPCVGAALAIYAGRAPITGLILRNPISVGIGLISYSLYLVHWPIVVFYNYALGATNEAGDPINGISLSTSFWLLTTMLTCAYAMYRFVEVPFRTRAPFGLPSTRAFATSAVAAALLLSTVGVHAYSSGGWLWRLSEKGLVLASLSQTPVSLSSGYECHYRDWENLAVMFERCKSKGNAVIVMGDSHAGDLFGALSGNTERPHVALVNRGNCRIGDPSRTSLCKFQELLEFVRDHKESIDAVIYTQIGRRDLPAVENVADMRGDPAKMKAVADWLDRYAEYVPTLWAGPQFDPYLNPSRLTEKDDLTQSVLLENQRLTSHLDRDIADFVKGRKFRYVSKYDAMRAFLPDYLIVDGKFTYYDNTHWNAYGEKIFGAALVNNDRFLRRLFGPDYKGAPKVTGQSGEPVVAKRQ